jgi:hypothetical protein
MIWDGGGTMKLEAGLSRTFTKALPTCPKLSVTFSWNRRSVSAVTLGAINSHTAVFTPLKVLGALVGICFQEYDRIIPLGALLFDPFRNTVDPAVTTWSCPALPMGGGCKDWWLLLKLEFVVSSDEGFLEDDGDAKTKGVEPLLCCSWLVAILFTAKVFVNWARDGLSIVVNKSMIENESTINNSSFNYGNASEIQAEIFFIRGWSNLIITKPIAILSIIFDE